MRLSRGFRNNNPGNIRLSVSKFRGEVNPSEDEQFKQFETIEWGYRAMFLVIHNYGVLYGITTLDKIISRWAPACENHTSEYINLVAKTIGRPVNSSIDSLDRETMVAMVGAMAWVENGVKPDMMEVEGGWRLFVASHK